jgi:thioredoxin-related protein
MRQFALLASVMILFSALALGSSLVADDASKEKDNKAQKTENGEINWMRYDEGVAKAKKEDKHVFIDFTTSWCKWCKVMDKETFSRPDVIDLLNNHFVAVKVDGEGKTELDIDGYKITERNLTSKEFGVRGFPSFWFLKSDGTKLGNIRGYRPAEFMIEAFKFVKDRKYDSTAAEGSQKEQEG